MILFIVTNFNNTQLSINFYESIKKCSSFCFKLIIVDNSSNSVEVQALSFFDSKSEVIVLKNEKNVGYFPGLNVGIRYVREHFREAKCVIVGNNDILLPSDFELRLSECDEVLDKYPVIAPNIKMLDGTPQNPHVISGISKIREFIYDIYHSSYFLAGLVMRLAKLTHRFTDRKDERQHEVAQEIYQGYGALYILTPKFFENFDELWAPTFLMYEEFFLAKQLEDKGFKTYYEPRVVVTHICHASTGTIPGKFRWAISRRAHKEYRKYVKVWGQWKVD